MRTLTLAAVLIASTAGMAPAQTTPKLTYPDAGSFCGFLKPCTAETAKTTLAE